MHLGEFFAAICKIIIQRENMQEIMNTAQTKCSSQVFQYVAFFTTLRHALTVYPSDTISFNIITL